MPRITGMGTDTLCPLISLNMDTTCHDCGKTLKKGEEYMPYEANGNTLAKCRSCHEAKPELTDFQKVETYTRVVGYIRPVEQWNKGKQQEYADRLEYDPTKE